MLKRLFMAVMLVCGFVISQAQSVSFTASAKKVVSVGERFRLIYSLNAEGENFVPPYLNDFSVLSGPSTSSSSSVQIMNGQITQSVSLSYTYVLEAAKEGKFTIKPAQVNVDGKTYKSNSIEIEVVKGSAPQQQGGGQQQSQQQAQRSNTGDVSDDDLFVRVALNKTNVYEGEPIVATLKVYVRSESGTQLSNFKDYKFPSFQGFYSQVIEEPKQISLDREALNGKVYDAGLFKKVLLYPQKSGKITIDPFELECIYLKRVARPSFFDNGYREFSKKVSSSATTVNIKALPDNAPASFGGAVGSFGLSVKLSKNKVKANESISLTAKITGTGNLKLAEIGKVEFPADFETYDPKMNSDIKNSASGSSGFKSWEYLVIPRHAGTYKLPAVKFSYFDTQTGRYKELSSEDFDITVEKGAGGDAGPAVVQGFTKEDIKFIGSDIRFINVRQESLSQNGFALIGSGVLWLLYALPLLALMIIVVLRRKQIQENSNLSKVKNKNANKVSRKRLKQASLYMKEGKDSAFYEELVKALWGYIGDKLAIPVSELTKDRVTESLAHKSVDAESSKKYIALLDQCEFARFAPSAPGNSKEQLYVQAEAMINEFEKTL